MEPKESQTTEQLLSQLLQLLLKFQMPKFQMPGIISFLLEQNQERPVQNLGMANALLHHGMVMQVARFYGAALQDDTELANPDLYRTNLPRRPTETRHQTRTKSYARKRQTPPASQRVGDSI